MTNFSCIANYVLKNEWQPEIIFPFDVWLSAKSKQNSTGNKGWKMALFGTSYNPCSFIICLAVLAKWYKTVYNAYMRNIYGFGIYIKAIVISLLLCVPGHWFCCVANIRKRSRFWQLFLYLTSRTKSQGLPLLAVKVSRGQWCSRSFATTPQKLDCKPKMTSNAVLIIKIS